MDLAKPDDEHKLINCHEVGFTEEAKTITRLSKFISSNEYTNVMDN